MNAQAVELLRALDGLGHRARRAHLAGLARTERGPGLAALQAELESSGDGYQARLALELADSAGDAAGVLRALTSLDADLAVYAARLAGRHAPSAEALRPLLPALSQEARRALWRALALSEREAVAEALLDEVLAAFGPAEAALLLPGCGEAVASRVLPEVAHALHNWRGLARRHPALVLGWMRRELSAAPESGRRALWFRFGAASELLAELRPAELLDLGLALGPPTALPFGRLGLLLRREPARTFALLTAPSRREQLVHDELPVEVAHQLRKLSPEHRVALLRPFRDDEHELGELLRNLPYPARAEVYEALYPRDERSGRQLASALVSALPARLRDAEAARIAALPRVAELPGSALDYLRLRDIDAARPGLEAAARGSKAEERGQALYWLLQSTGLSRRGLTQTLAFAERLKNEQDPVRYQAALALSTLPPSLIAEEHLEALRRQVTWAVEARDTSGATRSCLQNLAFRLMRHHAAQPQGPLFGFALWTLRALAGQAFPALPPDLGRGLPRGAEGPLFEALRPALKETSGRHDHGPALALAASLGRRAWGVPELQALLERATQATNDGPAHRGAELWLADPASRDARVRALLDRDRSWITSWTVVRHLHLRRQEWLDPYLTAKPTPGRFLEADAFYLLPLRDGFHRWLPRQQQAFAGCLAQVADREEASSQERAAAVWVLGKLPSTRVADLAPRLAGSDVPMVEAALGALAWLSRPAEALPLLLQHLDGDPTGVAGADRARVAMYAAPRCARRVAPAVLAQALSGLLERPKLKVTVHKEALRLLGAFRPPGAAELLARDWARPELHRDVRIAAGHAARRLLDAPVAWQILGALATDAEPDLPRSLLGTRPSDMAPAYRPRYAALLLQVPQHPVPYVRGEAFANLVTWAQVSPAEIGAAAQAQLVDLARPREWLNALGALLAAAGVGATAPLLEAARGLGQAAVRADVQPMRSRDLPARQRLRALVEALCAQPEADRRRLGGALGQAAQALGAELTLWPQAAALRLAALPWEAPEAAGEALLDLARQARAEAALGEALERALVAALGRALWEPEALLRAADRLAGEAPRLALRLVAAAGAKEGWPDAALARLGALRARGELGVRLAALELFVTDE